jgi:hypothetical protein
MVGSSEVEAVVGLSPVGEASSGRIEAIFF